MRIALKKTLPLVAALCLLLTACGKTAAAPFDPAAAAAALTGSDAFSQALEALDADTATTYYGLDPATVTDSAVYGSLSAGAEEIAVLVLTDEKTASAAKTLLQTHLEDQKIALKDYQPAEMPKLDSAILVQRGNSIALVVAADAQKAQTVLDGLK